MRKASPILLVTTLILFSLLSTISFSAEADPWPVITLEAPSVLEIDVAPGSNSGRTSFWGNITCESTNPEEVFVKLLVSNTHGSSCVSPVGFVFDGVGTETKYFRINITIPILTSSYEDPVVNITGTWSQGGYGSTIEPFTIQVKILPFYRLTVFSELPVKDYTPGQHHSYMLRLENTGNIDDNYTLEVQNLKDLKTYGVSVELPDTVFLEERNKEFFQDSVDVYVNTSSDTKVRVYNIWIICTSLASQGNYHEEFVLYLKVIPGPIQLITSPIALILIAVLIIMIIVFYIRRRKMVNLS